jgi:hypothetical protein
VVRAGYGIFYTQAFYPGWQGGMAQDGFNATPSVSSSNGGLTVGTHFVHVLEDAHQRRQLAADIHGMERAERRDFALRT